ncbi:hypothetical protein V8C86DRAFT_2824947, partial [Haematococcus lacustris]
MACLITFTLAWPDLVQPVAGPHLPATQVSKLLGQTFPLWACCWEVPCLLCGVPGLLSALMQAMPGAAGWSRGAGGACTAACPPAPFQPYALDP